MKGMTKPSMEIFTYSKENAMKGMTKEGCASITSSEEDPTEGMTREVWKSSFIRERKARCEGRQRKGWNNEREVEVCFF